MHVAFGRLTSVTQTEVSGGIQAATESLCEMLNLQNGMGFLTVYVPYHTYQFLENVSDGLQYVK